MNNIDPNKKPTLPLSLIPIFIIVLLLTVGYGIFRIEAEVLLVIAAFLTGILARLIGFSWELMQKGIVQSITKALPAMLIVITVGILIGSWIISFERLRFVSFANIFFKSPASANRFFIVSRLSHRNYIIRKSLSTSR